MFGTKLWLRNNPIRESPYGEVWRGRFNQGRAPAPLPEPKICGPKALIGTITEKPGKQPPVSNDGIPVCCRPCNPDLPFPVSALSGDGISLAFAAVVMELAAEQELLIYLDDIYSSFGWTRFDRYARINEGFDFFPSFFLDFCQEATVIGIAGTPDIETFALQIVYGAGGPVPIGGFGSSPLYSAAAILISNQIAARSIPANRPIIIAGFSMGGAIASVFSARLRLWNPDVPIYCYSFASPKPFDAAGARQLSKVNYFGLYRDYDPIPLLPPSTGWEWLVGLYYLPWLRWQHPEGRQRIAVDGALTVGFALSIALDVADMVNAVINGDPVPDFPLHNMRPYACYPLSDFIDYSNSCIWTNARIDALRAAFNIAVC